MSYQSNNPVSIPESALLNVEYLPNTSYRSDTSKGVEIHKAINTIQGEILEMGGIAKSSRNTTQNYQYRSITAIYAVITPLMVKHKITCIGSTERSSVSQFFNNKKELSFKAIVQIRYVFTSIVDGSVFEVVMIGEANDTGDKAVTKATTSAQKNMYNQVFAIPTGEGEQANQSQWNNNGYQDGRDSSFQSNSYQKKQNGRSQPKRDPNKPAWTVKKADTPQAPNNNKTDTLASPQLKQHIMGKFKNWGIDLNEVINKIGLNMDAVTDIQLRNVFEEVRADVKAKTAQPIQ